MRLTKRAGSVSLCASARSWNAMVMIVSISQISSFEGQRCLEVYPPNEWTRLAGTDSPERALRSQLRSFELFYIGGAHEVLVDKQGRILVPPKLREFAALDGDVTFSAMTDHFQLWDKAVLEQVLKATEQRFSDPEFFQKLGLVGSSMSFAMSFAAMSRGRSGQAAHVPVMAVEVVELLSAPDPLVIVDATLGDGGPCRGDARGRPASEAARHRSGCRCDRPCARSSGEVRGSHHSRAG